MSEATERLPASRSGHARIVGVVSAAHFVSHYYILLLPPLFPFVRADYGVTYTQLGFALAAFNVVSAALQTPAGFLVDRLGARVLLIAGLLLGAAAFMTVGMTNSFWLLVAMFALAGVGNTVYHPADYALLSHHVPGKHIGQAFSIHTFAGMLGSAVAPGSLLLMQSLWGWRGAFIGAAVLGLAVALVFMVIGDDPEQPAAAAPARGTESVGWRLLLSPAILLNLGFFVLLAMMSGGMYNYSVVALGALDGTPLATANGALTAHLFLSAIGVLIGGVVATRTSRHGLVATLGLACHRRADAADRLCRSRRVAAGRGDGGRRLLLRRHHAVARHDRARGHPARLVRQGVRLRHHRVQSRRHRRAARLRRHHGPRQPAAGVRRRRRLQPDRACSPWRRCRGAPNRVRRAS